MILKTSKSCYFVALDFLKKKVVITIRCTETIKESIAKIQMKATKIPNTDSEWYGNEEIVRSAEFLKDELISKKIIEKALNYDSVF
jgi:hypothetical protein